jgi:hypothetical protein
LPSRPVSFEGLDNISAQTNRDGDFGRSFLRSSVSLSALFERLKEFGWQNVARRLEASDFLIRQFWIVGYRVPILFGITAARPESVPMALMRRFPDRVTRAFAKSKPPSTSPKSNFVQVGEALRLVPGDQHEIRLLGVNKSSI